MSTTTSTIVLCRCCVYLWYIIRLGCMPSLTSVILLNFSKKRKYHSLFSFLCIGIFILVVDWSFILLNAVTSGMNIDYSSPFSTRLFGQSILGEMRAWKELQEKRLNSSKQTVGGQTPGSGHDVHDPTTPSNTQPPPQQQQHATVSHEQHRPPRPYLRRGAGLTRYGLPASTRVRFVKRPGGRSTTAPSSAGARGNQERIVLRSSPRGNGPSPPPSRNSKARVVAPSKPPAPPRRVIAPAAPPVTSPLPAPVSAPAPAPVPAPVPTLPRASTALALSNQATAVLNVSDVSESTPQRKKEKRELHVFEMLEQAAADSSFCSTSSFLANMLTDASCSTPQRARSGANETPAATATAHFVKNTDLRLRQTNSTHSTAPVDNESATVSIDSNSNDSHHLTLTGYSDLHESPRSDRRATVGSKLDKYKQLLADMTAARDDVTAALCDVTDDTVTSDDVTGAASSASVRRQVHFDENKNHVHEITAEYCEDGDDDQDQQISGSVICDYDDYDEAGTRDAPTKSSSADALDINRGRSSALSGADVDDVQCAEVLDRVMQFSPPPPPSERRSPPSADSAIITRPSSLADGLFADHLADSTSGSRSRVVVAGCGGHEPTDHQQRQFRFDTTGFSSASVRHRRQQQQQQLSSELDTLRHENEYLAGLRSELLEQKLALEKERQQVRRAELERQRQWVNTCAEHRRRLQAGLDRQSGRPHKSATEDGSNADTADQIGVLKDKIAQLETSLASANSSWSSDTGRLRSRLIKLQSDNKLLRQQLDSCRQQLATASSKQLHRQHPPVPRSTSSTGASLSRVQLAGSTCSSASSRNLPRRRSAPSLTSSVTSHTRVTSSSAEHTVRSADTGKDSSQPQPQQPAATVAVIDPGRGAVTGSSTGVQGRRQRSPTHGVTNVRPMQRLPVVSVMRESCDAVAHNATATDRGGVRPSNTATQSASGQAPVHGPLTPPLNSSGNGDGVEENTSTSVTEAGVSLRHVTHVSSQQLSDSGDSPRVQWARSEVIDLTANETARLSNVAAAGSSHVAGVTRQTLLDGTRRVCYDNNDWKETSVSGDVVYYYASTGCRHTTYSNGSELVEFANGQIERRDPSGIVETRYPCGSLVTVYSNGEEHTVLPDGTRQRLLCDGTKELLLPQGRLEVHTPQYKKLVCADGTVKYQYSDGRQETRYVGGRVRIRNSDGQLVLDTQP